MWWFGRIKVSPDNENKVFHIGFTTNMSPDGGNTWFDVFEGAHVDQHEIWIDPNNPDRVYLGNDGGVYYSNNGGLTHQKIDHIPITQFYRCEIDHLEPHRLYGGSQDNSTMRTLTGGVDDWQIIYGGDGFTALVDPTDNNFVYATSQYGNMRRSINGGLSFMSGTDGINPQEPNNWNTPYVFDPNNPEIMYYGTNRLYRSTDRAITWLPISEDLSNGPYFGLNPFGTLTSISVSPFDANQIIVGTDDGNVWITNNLGNSWEILSNDLSDRWVTSVVHHPTIEDRLYVTFSGYRYGDNSAYIYAMDYANGSWEAQSVGLPQVPINDLLIIPSSGDLVVATDVGVFIREENEDWKALGEDLPNVIMTDLDYHEGEDKLVVATYGRSLYTFEFDSNVSTTDHSPFSFDIFPNPANNSINLSLDDNTAIDKIWITAMDGKKFDVEKTSGRRPINISYLPAGKYILSMQSDRGVQSKPFIVLRE